jgi:hypothetical protein
VQVQADTAAVSLTYRIEGETPGGLWLSIPVLLWDGADELHYRIAGTRVELDWQSRAYVLTATAPEGDGQEAAPSGAWLLRRERFLHTGFGVTGNFALALGPVRAVRMQLAPR